MSATRTGPRATGEHRAEVKPWPVEWAAEGAVVAVSWLARHYPTCDASEALHPHEGAANTAAMAGEQRGGAA